jgi:hypothetical protein
MKTYLVGTALTAIVLFGAAGVPLADPLASGPFELTGPQLDAVTAGSTGGEAVAAAIATGELIALAQTGTTTTATASFLGDEIHGSAATAISTGVAIGAGEGAGRAAAAEADTTAEGDVVSGSGSGTVSVLSVEISYAISASFGTVGPHLGRLLP